jgi:hypothetical protein
MVLRNQHRSSLWITRYVCLHNTHPVEWLIFVSQRLVYFDSARTGSRLTLDDAIILPALGDAMKGTLDVRHSENIVERIVRVSLSSFTRESDPHRCLVHEQQAACYRKNGERAPLDNVGFLCAGYLGRILDNKAAVNGRGQLPLQEREGGPIRLMDI